MKNIIFLFVASIICGCSGNGRMTERERLDSIAKVEEKIKDSLERIRMDSLSLFAWGDAKFGMSEEEILGTKAFKNGELREKSIVIENNGVKRLDNSINLGTDELDNFEEAFGLKEALWSFYAMFENGELTSIKIKSYEKDASHIDDLVHDCNIFAKNFTSKMGKPTYLKNDVSIFDFNEGESFTYASFNVGEKWVFISLSKSYSGNEYQYTVSISNNKFPTKKYSPSEKEIKEAQEERNKKEDIINNSF